MINLPIECPTGVTRIRTNANPRPAGLARKARSVLIAVAINRTYRFDSLRG